MINVPRLEGAEKVKFKALLEPGSNANLTLFQAKSGVDSNSSAALVLTTLNPSAAFVIAEMRLLESPSALLMLSLSTPRLPPSTA
mmetsp:Transcript_2675/g.4135  ORF Transcript_2675/g.4135 Transcript_2675/m.4135 type:complete len:85 (-) Transcript_2675:1162-1416(-)